MAKPEASVCTSKVALGSSGSMSLREGAFLAASLTAWKESYSLSPHFQATSFLSKSVSGATILA